MLRRFSSQTSFGVVSRSKVIYDGSGSLANINDVLQGFLRDPLQTYLMIQALILDSPYCACGDTLYQWAVGYNYPCLEVVWGVSKVIKSYSIFLTAPAEAIIGLLFWALRMDLIGL